MLLFREAHLLCTCSLSSWPVLFYNEDDESGQQPTWKILFSWALQPDLAHFPAPGTGNAVSGLWVFGKRHPRGCPRVKKEACWGKKAENLKCKLLTLHLQFS